MRRVGDFIRLKLPDLSKRRFSARCYWAYDLMRP